jgi:hypothetical protein
MDTTNQTSDIKMGSPEWRRLMSALPKEVLINHIEDAQRKNANLSAMLFRQTFSMKEKPECRKSN